MKKIIIAAVISAFVAGCATSTAIPTDLTSRTKSEAKTAILSKMRDPSSAIFGPMTSYQISNGETAVCAQVNGKNGFGGMTGFQTFLVNFGPARPPLVFWGDPAYAECSGLARGGSMRI